MDTKTKRHSNQKYGYDYKDNTLCGTWVIYTIVACITLYHSVQSHWERLEWQLGQLAPKDDKNKLGVVT